MADFIAAIVAGIGAGIGFALVGKAFSSMGKSTYPDRMKCLQCFNEILLPASVFQWYCPCCNTMNPGNKQNKICFRCGAGKPSRYKYYVICGYCSFKNEVPKNRLANSVNSTKTKWKKLVKPKEEKSQIEGQSNNNNTTNNNTHSNNNTSSNIYNNNSNNNSTIQTAPLNNNNPPGNSANPPGGLGLPGGLLQGRHFTLGGSTSVPNTSVPNSNVPTKSLE